MNTTRINLPVIIADTGTHFQIYNPRNLDTYFVKRDDFFALATDKSKSIRYRVIKTSTVENFSDENQQN